MIVWKVPSPGVLKKFQIWTHFPRWLLLVCFRLISLLKQGILTTCVRPPRNVFFILALNYLQFSQRFFDFYVRDEHQNYLVIACKAKVRLSGRWWKHRMSSKSNQTEFFFDEKARAWRTRRGWQTAMSGKVIGVSDRSFCENENNASNASHRCNVALPSTQPFRHFLRHFPAPLLFSKEYVALRLDVALQFVDDVLRHLSCVTALWRWGILRDFFHDLRLLLKSPLRVGRSVTSVVSLFFWGWQHLIDKC